MDPYVVFRKMLERGRPPDEWDALLRACHEWSHEDAEASGAAPFGGSGEAR